MQLRGGLQAFPFNEVYGTRAMAISIRFSTLEVDAQCRLSLEGGNFHHSNMTWPATQRLQIIKGQFSNQRARKNMF